MTELSLQSDVVKAVNAHGGAGKKLSHRFLVGVSDLLVKVPDFPAALLEAKFTRAPVRVGHIDLDVTVPQQRFLEQFRKAGMITGVVSFVRRGQELGILFLPTRDAQVRVLLLDHTWCKLKDKDMTIWNQLVDFLQEESHGGNKGRRTVTGSNAARGGRRG